MNRRVRGPVFETNSSSVHTLSICSNSHRPAILESRIGIISIMPGEFGWGPDTYRDTYTKASYCLTYCLELKRDDLLERLRAVMESVCGCKIEFVYSFGQYGITDAYIDHQSIELDAGGDAFQSEQSLKDFIFNPASVLEIDNDNH